MKQKNGSMKNGRKQKTHQKQRHMNKIIKEVVGNKNMHSKCLQS